jgi:hypothetical protein
VQQISIQLPTSVFCPQHAVMYLLWWCWFLGGLIDAHTGEQHCWRCSSKELEEFSTKFSALKLCETIQAFW